MSALIRMYRFHYPEGFTIGLFFELLTQDHVLARQEIGRWQKIVLARLLFVILFIESSFIFFKIFIKHVFAAQFIPPPKMINSHIKQHSILLEDPINLLFFTPH